MIVTSPAPIALFVYNRPEHTRRTVEALCGNAGADESDLFVYSDAPATEDSAERVAEVRAYVHSLKGFRSVHVIERDQNLGLARSIIDGVTQLCHERGRVIVVEDDLLTSRWFLKYLNDGLEVFACDDQVASIHAYLPPVSLPVHQNFFLYGADCWGWATWQRAWTGFVADGGLLLREIQDHPRRRYFDYIGNLPHTAMLKGYMNGSNNSWAIRWHASAFVREWLTLHPARTLVTNIGLDGSGTHCSDYEEPSAPVVDAPLKVERIPLRHSAVNWQRFRWHYVRQIARRAARKVGL